jgi:hypothetical protein
VRLTDLRQETRDVFYHGFRNYMIHAFPEDELRPLTCGPLTRDRENPAHIEVNDVLGNYSLTLIDSLSTLAILASTPEDPRRNQPLDDFQDGIAQLVRLYGDGSEGQAGQGERARGFEMDSKVQVFETVIRGLGGLLSAHLFAVGDLPIRGYDPQVSADGDTLAAWPNGFTYNGQLLRLATDLGSRLLPAFDTPTGLPYPRVNLKTGIPFYGNAPVNLDPETGQCKTAQTDGSIEITETCSAGAGSLVLEFATLSRLTGDDRFEIAAKNAFWAVWTRRSSAGLIGAGIDAETGNWVSPYTGIGAGIDSFFEYAVKSHILLSNLEDDPKHDLDHSDDFLAVWKEAHAGISKHIYRGPIYQHPHYIQVDLYTGAMRAFWIDSLSAYYPGLLALAGELDEAIDTHLLYAALWTRYSALPERWSTTSGTIEHGLTWWGGRPEFIESTWYLYRATQDPFYLHVGEMTIRDIKRRCWTPCGWAGLQNVESGELNDRMESFFLGETAKYLFLLFDPSHPLNSLDAPYVFTTEGHPLVIPPRSRQKRPSRTRDSESVVSTEKQNQDVTTVIVQPPTCPLPPPIPPLTFSAVAAREDLFHAAALARLHLVKRRSDEGPLFSSSPSHPGVTLADIQSPTNYTYYPWTLPLSLVPPNATCSPMAMRSTFDLSFPISNTNDATALTPLSRIDEGILINSMSGLRFGMIRESHRVPSINDGVLSTVLKDSFRIYAISTVALGRDEKVLIPRELISSFNPVDPHFSRSRDLQTLDLVLDIAPPNRSTPISPDGEANQDLQDLAAASSEQMPDLDFFDLDVSIEDLAKGYIADEDPTGSGEDSLLSTLIQNIQALLKDNLGSDSKPKTKQPPGPERVLLPAVLPTGPGAAPIPEYPEPPLILDQANKSPKSTKASPGSHAATATPRPGDGDDFASDLSLHNIYILHDPLCERDTLDPNVPRTHQVLVIRRGGCSFSDKLRNVPAYPPGPTALQLVIVIDDGNDNDDNAADDTTTARFPDGRSPRRVPLHDRLPRDAPPIQPLLDETQMTPGGIPRARPVPMVMVSGGPGVWEAFRRARGVGVRRRLWYTSQGLRIDNLIVL